ncbi:MAG TPA: ChaN family lipoprotein [Leptolyngbyaceae cyanobacterium M65_K2018_010]|nr:ChaN family lipoprotein [Leptolyngbyaceae cyanobacterium M65_K2018_010]
MPLGPKKLPWLVVSGATLAWSLALVARPVYSQTPALPLVALPTQEAALSLDPWDQLRQAQVIYLGERHDSAADHAAQLAIIQALYHQNPNLAIAMEMFQRPFQEVVNRYLAGELSEAELVEQTEYEQRWGFDWEFYAPIVRFAQAQGLPILALNAPSEISRQVARQGLTSLQGDDFRFIPPLPDIDTRSAAYRELVTPAFEHMSHQGHLSFENFFAAQVLWDETMAETIAHFVRRHPHTQVVVLAGIGHVAYGYGIPNRVERRLGVDLNQRIVLLSPPPDTPAEPLAPMADLLWQGQSGMGRDPQGP